MYPTLFWDTSLRPTFNTCWEVTPFHHNFAGIKWLILLDLALSRYVLILTLMLLFDAGTMVYCKQGLGTGLLKLQTSKIFYQRIMHSLDCV